MVKYIEMSANRHEVSQNLQLINELDDTIRTTMTVIYRLTAELFCSVSRQTSPSPPPPTSVSFTHRHKQTDSDIHSDIQTHTQTSPSPPPPTSVSFTYTHRHTVTSRHTQTQTLTHTVTYRQRHRHTVRQRHAHTVTQIMPSDKVHSNHISHTNTNEILKYCVYILSHANNTNVKLTVGGGLMGAVIG